MTAQIIPLNDRAKAVASLQAERESLQSRISSLSKDQQLVLARAYEAVEHLGKQMDDLLCRMSEIEAQLVPLIFGREAE